MTTLTLRERCQNVVRARLDRLCSRHMGRYEFGADAIVNDLSTALAAALQEQARWSLVTDNPLAAFMNARNG